MLSCSITASESGQYGFTYLAPTCRRPRGSVPPYIKVLLLFLLQYFQGHQCRAIYAIYTRLLLILQDKGSPRDMRSHQMTLLGL